MLSSIIMVTNEAISSHKLGLKFVMPRALLLICVVLCCVIPCMHCMYCMYCMYVMLCRNEEQ